MPLNGLGYFLRTDGTPGAFKKLLAALRSAKISGLEPVEVVAHDLLARVEQKPVLRLSITNILNRPLTGKLEVKLGSLTLKDASSTLELKPHETREVALAVTDGKSSPDNTYPLSVVFSMPAPMADGRTKRRCTSTWSRTRRSTSMATWPNGKMCCRSRSAARPEPVAI